MSSDNELFLNIVENENISEVQTRIAKRSQWAKENKHEHEGKLTKRTEAHSTVSESGESLKTSSKKLREKHNEADKSNVEIKNQIEDEFIVLDPDHPQMQKFQKSLKELLDKKTSQLSIEIRELNEIMKRKKIEREDIGVQLYNNQQELLKQQTNLLRQNDLLETKNAERQKKELDFVELKEVLEKKVMHLNKEKSKLTELQTELDNLNLRVFYLEHAKENIAGDIAAMKRAAVKSEAEMKKAEELKQNQDLFVERLTRKAIKLSEELEILKKQLHDQLQETKIAKEAAQDSQMELEILNAERKKLIQDWNSSLIALKKREEVSVHLVQDLNKLEESSQMLTTEKVGLQKLVEKEQERNEAMMSLMSRIEFDIQRVDKQTEHLKREIEEKQDHTIQLTKILQETELSYGRIINEKNQQDAILGQLRKDIEKIHKEKMEIEDQMMDKIQQQITLDTATKYTNKMIHKIRDRTKELDNQIANIENEISKKSMDETHILIENNYLEKMLHEYNVDVQDKYDLIAKNELDMNQRNVLIERKQNQIDSLTKKIDSHVSETGIKDATPMELQIKSLQKSITSTQEQVQQTEQLWLRDQAELVKLLKSKSKEEESMENYKNEITIFTQKLMRMEGQLARQNTEMHEIEKCINDMKHDTVKLNTLICKEKGSGDILVKNQKLSIKEFEASIKEAEREAIETQGRLESAKEDRENLFNALIEAEKQILLWTKKIQLAQETRTSVDGEMQNEIKIARNEVHRMEVRLQQLERDSEKRCQEMERLIANREANMVRGEAMKSRSQPASENAIKRELTAMKRKIREKARESEDYNAHLRNLSDDHKNLRDAVISEQTNLKRLTETSAALDSEIEAISEEKQKAFVDTVIGQHRMKCYQQLKENKYKKSVKSLEGEYKRQLENMRSTLCILNNLMQEFPEAEKMFRKATLIYGSRVK